MKFLKYLIYLLVALVLIFLAVGWMNPSVSYGHEVVADKPVIEAWAVSQDESKYSQWLDGFESIELLSGEHGKIGAKYKVVVDPGDGQAKFEMIETVVSIEEFDHVTMNFDSDFMDFEQTMTFEEADGKTSVKTDSKVMAKNIITRSMFAVMEMFGGSFKKQEAKNIEALKKLIEENTTDYYPQPESF